MAHIGNVILDCDIEYKGKIVFKDKEVSIYSPVSISKLDMDEDGIFGFVLDDWDSDAETYRANRDGYLYSIILNEWSSDDEVENFEPEALFTDFTLLVKAERCEKLVSFDESVYEPESEYY